MTSKVFAAVNLVMAVLFALAAAVQVNDPDPLRWMALYLAATAGCLLVGRVSWAWVWQAAVAAAVLVWGAAVVAGIEGPVDPGALFDLTMEMTGDATEQAREAGGLALVALWMATLTAVGLRARRRAARR